MRLVGVTDQPGPSAWWPAAAKTQYLNSSSCSFIIHQISSWLPCSNMGVKLWGSAPIPLHNPTSFLLLTPGPSCSHVWPLPAPSQSPSRKIFPKSFTQSRYACSQAAVWALQLCGHLYCNIGTGEHLSVSGDTTEKTTSKANINPVDIYNLVRGFSPSNI